jgi:hypothetical protein
MNRSVKILSSIAVATVFLSTSPASAATPVYSLEYYSDASLATLVGSWVWQGCDGDSPMMRRVGSTSAYTKSQVIGYCDGGQMYPE